MTANEQADQHLATYIDSTRSRPNDNLLFAARQQWTGDQMRTAVATNLRAMRLASGRGVTASEVADMLAVDDVSKVAAALSELARIGQAKETRGRWQWTGK